MQKQDLRFVLIVILLLMLIFISLIPKFTINRPVVIKKPKTEKAFVREYYGQIGKNDVYIVRSTKTNIRYIISHKYGRTNVEVLEKE